VARIACRHLPAYSQTQDRIGGFICQQGLPTSAPFHCVLHRFSPLRVPFILLGCAEREVSAGPLTASVVDRTAVHVHSLTLFSRHTVVLSRSTCTEPDVLAATEGACEASSFPVNRTGVQVMGLHCANASSPSACVAACCNSQQCSTWSWNPHHSPDGRPIDHCTPEGDYGPCWIGEAKSIVSGQSAWSGASKPGDLPPPPSPPPAPPPASLTNVWVRNLNDGSTAILFVNAATESQPIVCDVMCLGLAGLKEGTT
jgi:hypothetical protein